MIAEGLVIVNTITAATVPSRAKVSRTMVIITATLLLLQEINC